MRGGRKITARLEICRTVRTGVKGGRYAFKIFWAIVQGVFVDVMYNLSPLKKPA